MQTGNTKHITPETAFLPENRRLYLGGTDISAICGFNSYKSKYECWLEKTGQQQKEDDKDNPLFYWGHALEPLIADKWLIDNPDWELVSANQFNVDSEYHFLCANTDRIIRHKFTGEEAVLECKTVASYAFRHWVLGVPYTYYTQGQHYLGVLGYDRVIFAILVMDSRQLVPFEITRDDAYIEELRDEAVRFWSENVEGGLVPERTANDWANARATEKAVIATLDDEDNYRFIVETKDKIKTLEASLKEAEDFIKCNIGDNELMRTAEDKILFTWKGSDQNKVDTKKLAAEYPEAYAACVSPNYVRRFLTK